MWDWRVTKQFLNLRVLGEHAFIKTIPKKRSFHYKGKGEQADEK